MQHSKKTSKLSNWEQTCICSANEGPFQYAILHIEILQEYSNYNNRCPFVGQRIFRLAIESTSIGISFKIIAFHEFFNGICSLKQGRWKRYMSSRQRVKLDYCNAKKCCFLSKA